ncbi:hypothetical protein J437_LFUL004608 [Ladona fulva]|uniref:Uncharacterized protein n=1 Tax=Ladona fulva TaxID=123851 RepID=A0A8K0NXP2_LADFU|nr:hypothetical protein J437_LFUL004608 [Ladona fulva]
MGIDIPYNNGYTPPHLPVQNTAQAQRIGPIDHYGLAGRNLRERPPSETSLRMNALAMKYLSDEELASFEHLGVKRDPFQHEPAQFSEQQVPRLGRGVIGEVSSTDFTLYGMNGTNLSFTTLRYLQRYQLTPANGTNPQGMHELCNDFTCCWGRISALS